MMGMRWSTIFCWLVVWATALFVGVLSSSYIVIDGPDPVLILILVVTILISLWAVWQWWRENAMR